MLKMTWLFLYFIKFYAFWKYTFNLQCLYTFYNNRILLFAQKQNTLTQIPFYLVSQCCLYI